MAFSWSLITFRPLGRSGDWTALSAAPLIGVLCVFICQMVAVKHNKLLHTISFFVWGGRKKNWSEKRELLCGHIQPLQNTTFHINVSAPSPPLSADNSMAFLRSSCLTWLYYLPFSGGFHRTVNEQKRKRNPGEFLQGLLSNVHHIHFLLGPRPGTHCVQVKINIAGKAMSGLTTSAGFHMHF